MQKSYLDIWQDILVSIQSRRWQWQSKHNAML